MFNSSTFVLLNNKICLIQLHEAWKSHLMNNDTNNLFSHVKVPVKKRNEISTTNLTSFYGRYSALRELITPFYLKY